MRITLRLWFAPLVGGALSLGTLVAAAQHVPIHGVTGTIALPANVDKIYEGLNTVIVTATDGTRHIIHVTEGTEVHGADALARLERGTPVVVFYTVKGGNESAEEIDRLGPNGLKTTEGVVTRVDRVRKKITIKYANGTVETLRLTHHVIEAGEPAKGNRVIVYYADESGEKVAHYFKRSSP